MSSTVHHTIMEVFLCQSIDIRKDTYKTTWIDLSRMIFKSYSFFFLPLFLKERQNQDTEAKQQKGNSVPHLSNNSSYVHPSWTLTEHIDGNMLCTGLKPHYTPNWYPDTKFSYINETTHHFWKNNQTAIKGNIKYCKRVSINYEEHIHFWYRIWVYFDVTWTKTHI